MRQSVLVVLVTTMLFLLPESAMGLYTAGVSEQNGVFELRNVADIGWIAGGEFGLTEDFAVIADIGENNYKRAGLKFQLNPEFALIGGVLDSKLFLGVNFSEELLENLDGLVEFDFYNFDGPNRLFVDYELGLKFNLTRRMDIRGGMMGTITETETTKHYQLGVGYGF